MWSTHMAGGAAAWLGVSAVLPVPLPVALAGVPVAMVASLGPDIDSEQSKAARSLRWVTYWLSVWVKRRAGGHRAGMHSLLLGIPLCGLLGALAGGFVGLAAVRLADAPASVLGPLVAFSGAASYVGALSHSVLDSATNGGVAWLWPWRRRRYGFDLMRVGGWVEAWLVAPAVTGAGVFAAVAVWT